MQERGIVRRIDELGRLVIPKELRKTLRIREGDPLEIYASKDELVLKKYSPIGELSKFSKEYAESLSETTGSIAIITDRDSVIAVSGISKRDFMDKLISEEVEDIMENRRSQIINSEETGKSFYILKERNDNLKFSSQIIAPIVSEGDAIGTVILIAKDNKNIGELEQKLAETAAGFLAKQMEQ